MGILNKSLDVDKELKAVYELAVKKLEMKKKDLEAEFKQLTKDNGGDKEAAFREFRKKYRRLVRSPSTLYKGIIVGAADPWDTNRTAMNDATALFNSNSEKAIELKLTDAEGVPLDTREEKFGRENDAYGKPLHEEFIQRVWGIAEVDGELKRFKMTLGNKLAGKKTIPTLTPVNFRAIPAKTQKDEEFFWLNPSSMTEFESIEAEWDVLSLVEEHYGDNTIELGSIAEFHDDNADNSQRFCIFVADISYMDEEPNAKTQNKRVALDDDSIAFDSNTVTSWLPMRLQDMELEAGDRVVVVGGTVENEYQGNTNYLVNIQGIKKV